MQYFSLEGLCEEGVLDNDLGGASTLLAKSFISPRLALASNNKSNEL
jgi:hypothetical protein